ncbi:DUF3515 domain-containing protein [Corynebacterium suicordis]|uniref:DUF3515 domain-containing protein n=1 Tax=Corynebacterium suicordis DSM 45110 TaxID=1121369 RepID=A0ABR9ZIV2_9CORY|nr:DUF3515 domain-containing protein [Corynebacterium suicordis]MBF4553367.1 DUF3515 domain-containing protein [Corynebacterium suicordis DSM 45110]MDR6277658.1 hypothetical protein [Corynebacterium suicordis]
MSTQVSTPRSGSSYSRVVVVLALVLAVVFTFAVIAGARIFMERQSMVPVAMGQADAPDAQSSACTDYVGNLPDSLGDYRNVGIVDPAPAGAAAFRNLSKAELTVRCGVRMPDQYTVLSETVEAGGARWFEVNDATPGSTLRTWYLVDSSPTVAITADADIESQLADLGEASHSFTADGPAPGAYPLSTIPMAQGSRGDAKAAAATCDKFLNALPQDIENYSRTTHEDAPSASATYLSQDAAEPVVVRCGAELPESYAPGERVTQVDDVAWFAEPKLAQGSTVGVWYALSHQQIVAISMPNNAGNAVVNAVTTAISQTMEKEDQR